jgi:hypothetical protein
MSWLVELRLVDQLAEIAGQSFSLRTTRVRMLGIGHWASVRRLLCGIRLDNRPVAESHDFVVNLAVLLCRPSHYLIRDTRGR